MELHWDEIFLPDELISSKEFVDIVKDALIMEWSPPEGLIENYDKWLENYKTWHEHLIPLESFEITLDEAIEKYGLPYFSPAEDPEKTSGKIQIKNVQRDNDDRLILMKEAKNRHDARWYMILHICWFNARTTWKIVEFLFPEYEWRIIESSGHVLVTTGTIKQLKSYLIDGVFDKENPFYIADPVIKGHKLLKDLMKDINSWEVFDNFDNYSVKCKRQFFF